MLYKTHQNEHDFIYSTTKEKKASVQPHAVPHLRTIIEMHQRGVAPPNLGFNTLSSEGFIPPQYSQESFIEIHKKYNHLKKTYEESLSQTTKSNDVDSLQNISSQDDQSTSEE